MVFVGTRLSLETTSILTIPTAIRAVMQAFASKNRFSSEGFASHTHTTI